MFPVCDVCAFPHFALILEHCFHVRNSQYCGLSFGRCNSRVFNFKAQTEEAYSIAWLLEIGPGLTVDCGHETKSSFVYYGSKLKVFARVSIILNKSLVLDFSRAPKGPESQCLTRFWGHRGSSQAKSCQAAGQANGCHLAKC